MFDKILRLIVCLTTIILVQHQQTEGSILSGGSVDEQVACNNKTLATNCGDGKVIVLSGIFVAFKRLGETTCEESVDDCLESLNETDLMWKEYRGQMAKTSTVTEYGAAGVCHTTSYDVISKYVKMFYHCINSTTTFEMCDEVNWTSLPNSALFLWNRGYPDSGILFGDKSCACSVTTSSATSGIILYILYMDLYDDVTNCQQSLTVTDEAGSALRSFNCGTLTLTGFTNETIGQPYIKIDLSNNATSSNGYFWIGFEALDTGATVSVSCPAVNIIVCPDPTNGTHANVSYPSKVLGSKAVYVCNDGYEFKSGNAVRYCQPNGQWDGSPLECIYQCGSPPSVVNGNFTVDNTLNGGRANYTCDNGYTIYPRTYTECNSDTGWIPATLTCRPDCPVPENGTNANLTYSDTVFDSFAVYVCYDHYVIDRGNVKRSCLENGQWNGSALVCIYSCGDPPGVENGTFSVNSNLTGGQANYSCNSGFTLSGNDTTTCIDKEGWNATAPSCYPDCPVPPTGSNSKVTYSSTAYGTEAVYVCDNGYVYDSGNTTLSCMADGQWNGIQLNCIYQCGEPPSLENGNASVTSTLTGGQANYICNSGFTLFGNNTTTCIDKEGWNATAPSCYPDCPVPATGSNSKVTYSSTAYGTEAVYVCDNGYVYDSGNTTLSCMADGQWNGIQLNCIYHCGRPKTPDNGNVTTTTTVEGGQATYDCISGFTLIGEATGACIDTVGWNVTVPYCSADCPEITNPGQGVQVNYSSRAYASLANFSCYPGYQLVSGNVSRICLQGGQWETSDIVCGRVECGRLNNVTNGSVSFTTTTFESTATYTCDSNYFISNGSQERECLADRSWSGTEPVCSLSDCDLFSAIPNLYINFTYGYFNGSIATFTCSPGYDISESYSLWCYDQSWNGTTPNCTMKDCGEPVGGQFSSVTHNGTTFGSVVNYTCNTNYSYETGNDVRYCTDNGIWNGTALNCTYDCGDLSIPTNCRLELNSTVKDAAAKYKAYPGYILNGSAERVCVESEGWNSTEPTCTPVNCGNPTSTNHTNVSATGGTLFMSTATYECETGYVFLSGDLQRHCIEDGSWNGTELTCVYDCGDLNHPENGNVVYDKTVTGGIANYSCAINYTLFGNKSRVCVDGLGWSGLEPPTCLKDCVSPDNGSYSNVTNTPELKQGSVAEYACRQNYTYLAGNEQRHCVEDGMWNGSALSCTYDCGNPDTPENGYLQVDKNVTGGRANYSCAFNYTLFGNESRVCNDGLGWIGSVPSCLKDCELPDQGLYSNVTNTPELKKGSVAEYVCHQNYTYLSGNELRYCVENGQWNGSALNCTFDCGQPDNPDNGNVTTNTVVEGGQATYTCITGFTLIGQATGTCIDTEGWNVTVPYCSPDCPELTNLGQGVKVNYSSRAYASVANYSCYPGYQNVSGNVSIICLQGGQWETGDFVCERVDCGRLNNVTNGSVSFTNTTFESTATYTCDSNYFISNGSQERECLADRSWSGTEPVCTLNDCDKFTATSNLNIHLTNGYFNGSIATFTCSPGYEISESYSLWCNDQSWNGTTPNCTIKDCGEPVGGQFSSVTHDRTTFGSVVNYTCDTNYSSETGNNVRFCMENGIWNGTALNCIYDCRDLTTPTNCRLELKSTVKGAAANYSAYPGYILNGSGGRVCIENAGWNGTEPTCTPVNCGDPTSTDHTNVSTTGGTLFMSTATYECETGYVYLSGDLRRHCIEDGSWNGTELTCVYDCGGPESPDNGYVHIDKSVTGGQANYSCAINYTLFGNESRICEDGLGWIGLAPTCKKDCLSPDQGLYSYVTNTPELKQGSVAEYACHQNYTYQSGNSQRYCIENGQWNGSALNCTFECGDLNDPENGNVIVDRNVSGGIANYSCAVNYTLFGNKSRVCVDGLGWFGLEPTTCLKDCMSPEDGSYSNVTNIPKLKQGSVAEYVCHQNYTYLAGNEQRYCVQNGQWNGSALICTYDCGKPDTLENGYLQVDKNVTGGRANYSCAPNYTLFGNKSRVCEDGLGWIGSVPACLKDCEQPDQGLYSSVTNTQELKQGSVAEYACHQNYTYLAGNEQRYCVDNGQWNGSALNCTYECGNLVAPVNGNVSFDKNVTGGEAYYVCAVNYTLSNNASRVCIDGQGWDGSAPTCRKDCGKSENITNGYVNMTTASYQSKATYGCDFGYFISSGSKERICLEGGEWSGSEPTCSRMDCGHIDTGSILLVNLSNGYFNDSIATFSCRPGYDLSEAYSLVCLNQVWNGTTPNCTKKDCRDPPSGINTNVITPQGTVFGSSAVFSCIANYTYVSGNIFIYCTEDGTWNGTSLSCVYDCREPPNMEHGNVSLKGTVTGERANYTCDEGFSLDGNEFRVCIADVGWNGSQPSCRKDCDIPNNGTNSLVSNNPRLAQGSLAEYTCRPNYTRIGGDERRVCMDNSQWNGSALNCAYDCRKPADLVNGNVQFKTPTVTNERVNYTCDNGFSLNGNVFRVCTADVGWNGSHPSCRKDCIQPENGSNSLVSNNPSLTQGSLAEYTCRPNYTRVGGDELRVCMENSQWNGSALNCAYVDCGRPPSVPNVRINVNATTIGSHANYTCDEGYDMPVGPIVKVCNSNGSWTENLIVCKPKKCGFVEKPIGGSILSAQNNTVGAVVRFGCRSGFDMQGTDTVKCLTSGQWSHPFPRCVANDDVVTTAIIAISVVTGALVVGGILGALGFTAIKMGCQSVGGAGVFS